MVAKRARRRIDPKSASRFLRTVSTLDKTFLFFTDVGKYTGKLASSLEDFLEKTNMVPLKSLEFHLGRRDFQKWIKGTLGDEYLANRIDKMASTNQGEEIRKTLQRILRRRLNQLKTAQKETKT